MPGSERDVRLKAALILVLAEGWTTADAIAVRLGAAPGQIVRAVHWLQASGYVERGDARGSMVVRWLPTREFEEAWDELIPERPCQLTFCKSVRARGALGSGLTT